MVTENQELKQALEDGRLVFASLACASEVILQQDKTGITDDMVSVVILNATIYMPFAELVDIRQEIERLEKEEKRLSGELARVNGMLNNERFMSKAPEAKVAEEREKLVKLQKMWALRKPVLDAHILSLQEKVQKLEMEVDEIVMEKMSCRS